MLLKLDSRYEFLWIVFVIFERYNGFSFFDQSHYLVWFFEKENIQTKICCYGQNSQNLFTDYEVINNFSIEIWQVNLVIVVSLVYSVHWLLLQSFHHHHSLPIGLKKGKNIKKPKNMSLRVHPPSFTRLLSEQDWIFSSREQGHKIATRHASLSFFFQGVLSSFSKAHSRTEKIDPLLQTCR